MLLDILTIALLLASIVSQVGAYFSGLLINLQTAFDIHLQRSLLIQGYITVIDTLIVPKFGMF